MGSCDKPDGSSRPSIEGPLFIYRAPIQLGGPSPSRVQIRATTHLSPEPILSAIASRFEDLADPVQVEPWRLIPTDTSRGKKSGASPPLLHAGRFPCFSLIWSPTTRSHGGSTGTGGIFFPHSPPSCCQRGVAWRVPGSLVTYRPPGSAVAGMDQW